MYAPKASATNTAILKKQQQIAEERKMGSPSMNFLRKIYNLISHKYEQLDEIKKLEAKLEDRYNGDLQLALNQAENGNWPILTREQLEQVKSKEQVQESIQEYMTIFNMYKQFHKKQEVAQPEKSDEKSVGKPGEKSAGGENLPAGKGQDGSKSWAEKKGVEKDGEEGKRPTSGAEISDEDLDTLS